jgi:hypothetical protein
MCACMHGLGMFICGTKLFWITAFQLVMHNFMFQFDSILIIFSLNLFYFEINRNKLLVLNNRRNTVNHAYDFYNCLEINERK